MPIIVTDGADRMILPGMPNGGGDPSQDAFASGLLAGAGLRELSQVLGLSRRRGQKPGTGGPMPSAATMLQGNMGDIDKILLLSRMQGLMGQGTTPDPLGGLAPMPGAAGPGGPMAGPSPLPPAAPPLPLPGAPVGPMPPLSPMGLNPMGAGVPVPGGAPGGGLPLQLLQQMLSGAGGIV